jgi:hypothetical protein
MPHHYKYRVVTEFSSNEDAEIDDLGRQILLETNNFQQARRECIEWAAWDDILVHVLRPWGNVTFSCNGAGEAESRYPKTVDSLDR